MNLNVCKKIITYPELRELIKGEEIEVFYNTHSLDNKENIKYKFSNEFTIPNLSP
jgi:hypothetical protein